MVIAFAAKNEAAGVGALFYYNAYGLIVNIAKQNTKLISLSKNTCTRIHFRLSDY